MKARSIALLVVTCATAVSGAISCGKGKASAPGTSPTPTPAVSSTPSVTTANLAGAVAIALKASTPFNAAESAGNAAAALHCQETLPTGALVKINSAGNATPVLSTAWNAAYFAVTTSHVIVRGAGLVTGTSGTQTDCCLLAIPRQTGTNPILCLSQVSPGMGMANRGVTTSANSVFFTSGPTPGSALNVMRWDGSSTQVETLLQLSSSVGSGPFAASGAANFCVFSNSQLICGNPALNHYAPVTAPGIGTEGFLIGSRLWTGNVTLDLATLTTMSVTNNGYGPPAVPTRDGGFIGIAGPLVPSNSITKISNPNVVTVLDQSGHSWQQLLGTADYAFVYGTAPPSSQFDLRTINLATSVVGTANYLSAVGLLQVSGMEIAGPDVLQLKGTGTNGLATSVFVDAVTGKVTAAPSTVSRYTQIQVIH